ncbi:MAG TPA: heparan-alpha-glucosaminide N-acetyltransferase domain-containing protein [Chryseolinea sp.]|nr:heparan-alpha-glucosaminide N-acetyltransferase domain-containing protein [Chryseolinea sp.]
MNTIAKYRITSIDFLRGAIMIIMALDHVRDYLYSGSFYFDPLDLEKTSGILFFTRWVTHFCAPIFMLLAGTSAYLSGQKKTKGELAAFLVKRGIWLVFLEIVVVNFGWNFNFRFPMVLLVTIWTLGISMILLAGLIYLPKRLILLLSLIIIAGHNLLDGVHVAGNTLPAFGWSLLHDQRVFLWHQEILLVGYPLLPFIAIMPLGYCLGQLYDPTFDVKKRVNILIATGISAIVLFIVIRYINYYGDPVKWTLQKNSFFTFLSFLKVNKYPPSLLYVLVTIGSACLFLGLTERVQNRFVRVVSVYGRVPMFYYLIHIYLIHLLAVIISMVTPGEDWHIWILDQPLWFTQSLKGYGFSLPFAYSVWVIIVIALYPLCKQYDRYKQTHKEKWWLSYL